MLPNSSANALPRLLIPHRIPLPAPVRHRLDEGELSAGHGRALLAAADPVALAAEVVRRGLNVRATERLVQRRAGKRPPKRRPRDADSVALERELGTLLGLRVTLEPKKRGGVLTLHYTSLDQLDRVLDLLRAPHPDSSPLGGLCILIASSTKTGSSRTKLSWSAA